MGVPANGLFLWISGHVFSIYAVAIKRAPQDQYTTTIKDVYQRIFDYAAAPMECYDYGESIAKCNIIMSELQCPANLSEDVVEYFTLVVGKWCKVLIMYARVHIYQYLSTLHTQLKYMPVCGGLALLFVSIVYLLTKIARQTEANKDIHKDWVTNFYCKYNPEMIGDVDKILKKYKGYEDLLRKRLLNKYVTGFQFKQRPNKVSAEVRLTRESATASQGAQYMRNVSTPKQDSQNLAYFALGNKRGRVAKTKSSVCDGHGNFSGIKVADRA
jgi:hypothetical protein